MVGNLMPTFDTLSPERQQLATDMANAARHVLFTHDMQPPGDDRAARFDEACAVLLVQSRPRYETPHD